MSYQREREQFIGFVSRAGMPYHVAEALLRAATTLERIAELECSSEAADRDRVPCPGDRKGREGSCLCRDHGDYQEIADGPTVNGAQLIGRHGKIPRIAVQAERIEARVVKQLHALALEQNPGRDPKAEHLPAFRAEFQGDPRGYVLKITGPSGRELGVPSRPTRLVF